VLTNYLATLRPAPISRITVASTAKMKVSSNESLSVSPSVGDNTTIVLTLEEEPSQGASAATPIVHGDCDYRDRIFRQRSVTQHASCRTREACRPAQHRRRRALYYRTTAAGAALAPLRGTGN